MAERVGGGDVAIRGKVTVKDCKHNVGASLWDGRDIKDDGE